MPEQNGSYFKRAWALLTRDKGWQKPILVLAAASFVPIVGALGLLGYALEWARLTAWGVDSAPKQKGVRIGECIKSGWRGLVAILGYGAAGGLLSSLIASLLGGGALTQLSSLVVVAVASAVAQVAALRATIYQSFGAGYQINRIWDMFQRDKKGFGKVALVMWVSSAVVGLVVSILFGLVMIPVFMRVGVSAMEYGAYDLDYIDSATAQLILFELADGLVSVAPLLGVVSFVGAIGSAAVSLITQTVTALWMRQFNVPAWGASEDPLPLAAGLPAGGYAAPQGSQDNPPQAPYGQPPYGPPVSMYGQGSLQPTYGQGPGQAQQGCAADQAQPAGPVSDPQAGDVELTFGQPQGSQPPVASEPVVPLVVPIVLSEGESCASQATASPVIEAIDLTSPPPQPEAEPGPAEQGAGQVEPSAPEAPVVAIPLAGGDRDVLDVELTSVGPDRIAVLNALNGIVDLDFLAVRDILDSVPSVFLTNVEKGEAEAIRATLEAAGATVTLR